MEAFVANLFEGLDKEKIDDGSYIVYFSGCNFKCPYCSSYEFLDFKNEHKLILKDLKKDIQNNIESIKKIIFKGGEPTLQRQALLELCRFAKINGLKTELETNGSKPDSLRSLVDQNIIDIVQLDIRCPLREEIFEKTTRSSTFFKPTSDIIDEIRQSIKILKNGKASVSLRTFIVPSLVFRKEDILEIAEEINELGWPWKIAPFEPKMCSPKSNFRNISPPTEKFIDNLKDICQKRYPGLKIITEERQDLL